MIEREAGRLERLVADLLALARLQERTFSVAREPFDLAAVAEESAGRARRSATELGIDLRVEARGTADALGDADRVLQAVSNLVENALRVTPRGGTVTLRATRGSLEVADAGPGIASEDLPRAFERFYLHTRAAARDGDRQVGSGLGLAIVKQLAEAMGGSAEVTSMPGEGATFTLRLPTPPLAATPPPDGAAAPAPAPGPPDGAATPVPAPGPPPAPASAPLDR